jgi:acyl CoA:acetate/3-ketoacid CoA transferase alpha subunit/acyl CoA:acetate/3-ketoacid CoA transferase beta subunit
MGKQVTLRQAVEATVRPGATVLFAFTHNRSHAAAFEVARQFRDRHCLDLVATGLLEYASILSAAGAVRRMESAFAGNTYPAPAPSRELGQAIDGSPSSDPDWTNLTMTLRLMAGAMGWPFVPTASLAGSDLWNRPGRAEVADPFGGPATPVMAALRPDVAFLHVPIADMLGNAVVHGPDAEESWGAWAARTVVVTAERVVSPEVLRGLGPRSGIPGQLVSHVVEAPFGAHPQGQLVWTPEEGVASYGEDYAFRLALRKRSRDPKALRAWVEDWVFGTDHEAYLARLGPQRLAALRVDPAPPPEVHPAAPGAPASPEERAATVAMRVARAEAAAGRAGSLFAGIGLAHLAAWAAEVQCRAAGVPVDLVAETGMIGFRPMRGDPYLFSRPNVASAIFHTSFVRTLGAVAGPNARGCLALLAAAQIDRRGNVNSSRTADGKLIVGSGGANDLASGAAACLVVVPLKPGRFVERLPFTTTPIRRLAAIATDLGVLARRADGLLEIGALLCAPGEEEATVAEIRRRTAADLPVAPRLARHEPPGQDELELLRSFDPERVLLA